jgi:hypothetical protein
MNRSYRSFHVRVWESAGRTVRVTIEDLRTGSRRELAGIDAQEIALAIRRQPSADAGAPPSERGLDHPTR